MKKPFDLIAAATINNGIGKQGKLPWKLPGQLSFFKEMTKNQIVVMGRKTYQSIGRPLPNRKNYVITRDQSAHFQGAQNLQIDKFDQIIRDFPEKVFVIGGAQIYSYFLKKQNCRHLFLSRIGKQYQCDTFLPSLQNFELDFVSQTHCEQQVNWTVTRSTSKNNKYPYLQLPKKYSKKHSQYNYLQLVKQVMEEGQQRCDRTGVGTLSLFGRSLRFDLQKGFPLLTTKQVFWKGVVEQLLWMIEGRTNSNLLSKRGVKIWDGNGSLQFIKKQGLDYKQGDLGPVYGFQWRHFGASYVDSQTNYQGKGVDQLANLVQQLKRNPAGRRHMLSAWNPSDIKKMVLPPCHAFAQFYVSADKKLSCQLYQRSCDLGLGVPFNIASYALLTHIIAKLCNYGVKQLIHIMGDAHIYKNHIVPLQQQLSRHPYPFPSLKVQTQSLQTRPSIQLINYNRHSKIAMQMSV